LRNVLSVDAWLRVRVDDFDVELTVDTVLVGWLATVILTLPHASSATSPIFILSVKQLPRQILDAAWRAQTKRYLAESLRCSQFDGRLQGDTSQVKGSSYP
jgi:hypothetical protein